MYQKTKKNGSGRGRHWLEFLLPAAAFLVVGGLASGDAATVGVTCVAYAVAPSPQCVSSTPLVTVRTEIGVGEDANFENAGLLLIEATGPNDNGTLNTVTVQTQEPLVGNGQTQLAYLNGIPSLVPAQQAATNLKQKNAIVIVDAASGIPALSVDVSSGAKGQNAGNVVVVADSLQTLKVTANGRDGLPGLDSLTSLAIDSILGTADVAPGIAQDYIKRRTATPSLGLPFDSTDLNDYAASGLACRTDETAVGKPNANQYAYDFAQADPGSVKWSIPITADAQEQTKRTFCQRNPEFTATQKCAAETEYGFQAVCSVVTEGRSVRFYKTPTVEWQRSVCTSGLDSQVRRKMIRTAHIEINIPGLKSYAGEISHEITFAESYNVFKENCKSRSYDHVSGHCLTTPVAPATIGTVNTSATDYWDAANQGLYWYNPFWKQDYNLEAGTKLEIAAGITVANDYNGLPPAYPTVDTSFQAAGALQGAKVSYRERPLAQAQTGTIDCTALNADGITLTYASQPGCSQAAQKSCYNGGAWPICNIADNNPDQIESLYYFNANSTSQPPVTTDGNVGSNYTVKGCANVISTITSSGSSIYQNIDSTSGGGTSKSESGFATYLLYFQAFDASLIGFSQSDLLKATITTSNCLAYEVMDGVVQGSVGNGDWVLVTNNSSLGPAAPPGTTQAVIANQGNQTPEPVATLSACPSSTPQVIGTETLLQYDNESSCYVDDPRNPATWPPSLLVTKAAQLTASTGQLVTPGDVTQADFDVTDLYSTPQNNWAITGAGLLATNVNSEFIYPDVSQQVLAAGYTALTNPGWTDYCVPVDQSKDIALTGSVQPLLTRSIAVPLFSVKPGADTATGSGVAIPRGAVKKICLSGIRLDNYLANVPRPTCQTGSSTRLALSKFSSTAGAPVWQTWSQQPAGTLGETPTWSSLLGLPSGAANGNDLQTLRSEFVDTRYDDLPAEIFTSFTNEVHPAVSVDPASAYTTGSAFPPAYGFTTTNLPTGISGTAVSLSNGVFTTTTGGSSERSFPGWLRQSSLVSNGSFFTPESFTPFNGPTLFDRSNSWCNAPAFVTAGNTLVKGFGAKAALHDVPKRVFGFTLQNLSSAQPGVQPPQMQYVGIEVIGTSNTQGFYSDPKIYTGVTSTGSNTPGVDSLQTSLSNEVFRVSNYPYLGARFTESCSPGQLYNQFTGFCHDPAFPWRSATRTIKRYLTDGVTEEPWAFLLSAAKLAGPPSPPAPAIRLDIPFIAATTSTPAGAAQTVGSGPNSGIYPSLLNIDQFLRMGFLRPMQAMADNSVVPYDVFLNRPEAFDAPVLGPGFASLYHGDPASTPYCSEGVRILAVPYQGPASGTVSLSLNRDGFLQGVTDPGGTYWGPVFVAMDPSCAQDATAAYSYTTTLRTADANGNMLPAISATTKNQLGIESVNDQTASGTPATPSLYLELQGPSGSLAPVYHIGAVYESIAAGMSATTGSETLQIVSLTAPKVRSRTTEWAASGRTSGGLSWQSQIATSPSAAMQSQSVAPLACATANVVGGAWGVNAATQAVITNGAFSGGVATSANCLDPASNCALDPEELSLFTQPVSNSKALTATRVAATQFTPWSHELPTTATPALGYPHTQPFGQWTVVASGADPASVPDCSIYNGTNDAVADVVLPRTSLAAVPAGLEPPAAGGAQDIKNPLFPLLNFVIVPSDPSLQQSDSCIQWDSITGTTCQVLSPTIGGPETGALVFGGTWQNVYVDTKTRVSQDCQKFVPAANSATGALTAECMGSCAKGGTYPGACVDPANLTGAAVDCRASPASAACSPTGLMPPFVADPTLAATDPCLPGTAVYASCKPCAADATRLCAPFMQAKAGAFTTTCSADSCAFPTNIQSFQVEAARPVSGQPGEDGTNSGSATIFCRDCASVNFSAQPGTGGLGSNPVSSQRSETLTCLSWNNNPLAPLFSVRELWSQPFVGGSSGQNGRSGILGGSVAIYQDMTPEAVFQISQPPFWLNTTAP